MLKLCHTKKKKKIVKWCIIVGGYSSYMENAQWSVSVWEESKLYCISVKWFVDKVEKIPQLAAVWKSKQTSVNLILSFLLNFEIQNIFWKLKTFLFSFLPICVKTFFVRVLFTISQKLPCTIFVLSNSYGLRGYHILTFLVQTTPICGWCANFLHISAFVLYLHTYSHKYSLNGRAGA